MKAAVGLLAFSVASFLSTQVLAATIYTFRVQFSDTAPTAEGSEPGGSLRITGKIPFDIDKPWDVPGDAPILKTKRYLNGKDVPIGHTAGVEIGQNTFRLTSGQEDGGYAVYFLTLLIEKKFVETVIRGEYTESPYYRRSLRNGTYSATLIDAWGWSVRPTWLDSPDGPWRTATEVPLSKSHFLSDATLTIAGGVPEPATWALMIGGLGLTGYSLRRRRLALA